MPTPPKPSTGTLMTRSRAISPEQKALFHNSLGAGRGKVIREFLGLTSADETFIQLTAEEILDRKLRDLE